MLLKVFHLFLFGTLESTHAFEHLVPVDKCTIKLGAVYADELGLSAYGKTTSTTHAGTVNHDGVKRNVGRDIVFLREQATELHHYRRPDGKYLVYMLLLDKLFHTYSNHSLFTIRAVICHYYKLVTACTHLVFQYYKVFIAPCND